MRRAVWIAALFLLMGARAEAQTAPTPNPQARPIPSVEAIYQRLMDMSAAQRTLDPAPGAPIVRIGPAQGGDLIAALPVRYKRVGYLEAPLMRDLPFSPRRAVLPAGAPVFATRFATGDLLRRTVDAWCGVAPEQTRPTGFCLLDMGGPQVAEAPRIGSPYMPRLIDSWFATSSVSVREDAAAQAAMPTMEMTYVFTEFDARDADVMTGVRIAGGPVIPNYNLSVPREADGSAMFRVGGGTLRLRPGAGRRDVIVEQIAPITAYNPNADEAELRRTAERIHQRMVERAAQPAPPANPTP
jgi:hypothetical protein